MATNQPAAWNWNNQWQSQWQVGDSQRQRDDCQRQRDETMLQQMVTSNTLLVGICGELKELNSRVQKIEEGLVDYKRNVTAGFSAGGPSSSQPAPPPPPLVNTSFNQPPPLGRSSRPRSGSWPLSTSSGADCGWHSDGTAFPRIDDFVYDVSRGRESLWPYWTHLDAIFHSDLGFTTAMCESLVQHMNYHRVELWHAPTSGSKNTRRLVVKCRRCKEGCGMVYGPEDLKNEAQVKKQKAAILKFLKLPVPAAEVF